MILCMSLMIVGLLLVPGAYSFTTKTAPCRIKTSIYVKQKHIKNACSITPLPESNSRFNIAIDGVEADLGKFSLMLFKQILQQAKNDPTGNQMVFKGYRPGVIPPQYLRKYHAYAMEQTCRETVKEGFSQNGYSVAELEGGEEDCSFVSFKFFPKVEVKKVSRKRKDVAALKAKIAAGEVEAEPEMDQLLANTFDESVKLGWEPGMDFSFVGGNVKVLKEGGGSPEPAGVSVDKIVDVDAVDIDVDKNAPLPKLSTMATTSFED